MKKILKTQMSEIKGGLAEGAGKRTLVRTTAFDGYAGNPCRPGRFIQRIYSDGSFETFNILGQMIESCYL